MGYFEDNYDSIHYPISTEHSTGLRRAQLGAIHAIASHFTRVSAPSLTESAMVVMPNGSGKTAVLILSAFILRVKRALVITPSRSVREQVTQKFQSLSELKEIGAISNEAVNPKVKLLDSKITTVAAWEELEEYDVVVSTPNCTSPEYTDIAAPPEGLFDLLLIDEAHHTPAKTWKAIIDAFPNAKKVLFTATPFRLDRKEIQGTIIYEFSIREAYKDKIFGDIEFVPVQLTGGHSADAIIALKTEEIYKQDQDLGLDHRILVRTNTKKHAKELKRLYEDRTGLGLRLIHSGQSLRYIDQSVTKLQKKELDGIICVDMLGEGFDFPNLKIAAIHASHKSLPITLQFVGRFARTGVERIGKAKFIAIPENIRIDAEQLYKRDKVWQEIIPNLYQSSIDRELRMRQAVSTFQTTDSATEIEDEVEDLSLYSLKLFHHVKIYELKNGANLDVDIEFDNLQVIRQDKSEELSVLLLLTKVVESPQWTSSPIFARIEYDLFVIYFDTPTNLLFINSSRRNETLYAKIARQVAIGGYKPLPLNKINRVLLDLKSLEFFNIGMRNRLRNSQIESYRIIAGPSAQRAVVRSDGRLYHRGHVFGRGESEDNRITLGYSSSSKVWSNKTSNISDLIAWCKELANKIVSDNRSVVTRSNIDHLSVGESLSSLPNNILTVDWNEEVYLHQSRANYQSDDSTASIQCQLLDLDLIIDRASTNNTKIRIRVQGPELDWAADFSPQEYPFFKNISSNTKEVIILKGYTEINLIDFLNEWPVSFYTVDQSLIIGSQIFQPIEGFTPYDIARIEEVDWGAEGVDIQNECGTTINGIKSIHMYLRDKLRDSDNDVVFYDHGTGEIADYITFKRIEQSLVISLYHVKASGGALPGARVADVYEVCGQVLKSTRWFHSDKLLEQIDYRVNRGHEFIKGDVSTVRSIVNEAQMFITYKIFLVQPGLSKAVLTPAILEVLASCNDYTIRNGGEALHVIASS